jgi:hypothetical protein
MLKTYFKSSVSDPDWIRIKQVRGSRSGIWIKEGKNDPHKYEKVKNFHVLKCWIGCSLLRAEGFSCSLDVLWRPGEK